MQIEKCLLKKARGIIFFPKSISFFCVCPRAKQKRKIAVTEVISISDGSPVLPFSSPRFPHERNATHLSPTFKFKKQNNADTHKAPRPLSTRPSQRSRSRGRQGGRAAVKRSPGHLQDSASPQSVAFPQGCHVHPRPGSGPGPWRGIRRPTRVRPSSVSPSAPATRPGGFCRHPLLAHRPGTQWPSHRQGLVPAAPGSCQSAGCFAHRPEC